MRAEVSLMFRLKCLDLSGPRVLMTVRVIQC